VGDAIFSHQSDQHHNVVKELQQLAAGELSVFII
jgi:hypothetical protein